MDKNKNIQKIKKSLTKNLKQIKKEFSKKKIKLLKFVEKEKKIINWNKISFYSIIILIFILFFGFWRYNLGSAKGFIKIFPQVAQGNFQNLNEILTLDNIETNNINSFNKNNSVFPEGFMQENMYSFEVNLKTEDLTIVLPNPSENVNPDTSTTTTTTLGSTEIIPVTTTTTLLLENSEVTTTTTIPSETTTITVPNTTTTTLAPDTTTTVPSEPTAFKKAKPFAVFLKSIYKNTNLLGLVSELVSDVIETTEEKNFSSLSKEIILSGFVLPELLEDEVLTQFSDQKNTQDILNVKLGLSFANKHFDPNTDATLTIDIFNRNSWTKAETIELKEDISNGFIGSYYYIGLGNINSVQDIEELKVKLTYHTSNSNEKDRLYIDSSWIEVAIDSDLEAIINDNVLEVENKLFTKNEDFYDFDQEIIITIPKEQSKIKKIYKETIIIENNIIEINKNQTIVIDTTTTTIPSETTTVTPPETTTTLDSNTAVVDSSTTTDTTNPPESQPAETTPVDNVESVPEPAPIPESPTPPPEAPAPSSEPAPSESPTSWIKKVLSFFSRSSKKLLASLADLAEETTTVETTLPVETTTTTNDTTTSTTLVTTTTLPLEAPVDSTTTSTTPDSATTTTISTASDTTTTLPLEVSIGSTTNTSTPSIIPDDPLVIREDLVAMNKFKIRSAILLTPNRRAFRNNITIDENPTEYIITIKQGPALIPGDYQLMIKYKDSNEFYRHFINFTWGGSIIKEIVMQEGNRCFFVNDKSNNQFVYVQIRSGENYFYNLKIRDLKIADNSPIGFIDNILFFLNEDNNMQGFDTLANLLFSQTLESGQDNYFNIKDKKYLITINNETISFTLQTN